MKESELPSTLQRSGKKAQDTFARTLQSAEQEYGEGGRARRTAFSSLKHTHEKVGDRWEPKDEFGPSDEAAGGGAGSSESSAGGVNSGASKAHLYGIARTLDVEGRGNMTKAELVKAIRRANDRETRRARDK